LEVYQYINDEYSYEKNFAIATMLAHVTAPADSYRFLMASAANSSCCVGFGLVLVEEQQRNSSCVDSDRAIPPCQILTSNAFTAVAISAEILTHEFQ
jgi:hypothetical protein